MEESASNNKRDKQPPSDANAAAREPDKPAATDLPDKPGHGPPSSASRGRWGWLVGAVILALVFLLGFLPMWVKAGRVADERDNARHQAKLLQLESLSAAAAIDARRGEYEAARQAASQFFTMLRTELDSGARSFLSAVQQDALRPLLDNRDGLITLLARNDPASAERMTEVYLACRKTLRPE